MWILSSLVGRRHASTVFQTAEESEMEALQGLGVSVEGLKGRHRSEFDQVAGRPL